MRTGRTARVTFLRRHLALIVGVAAALQSPQRIPAASPADTFAAETPDSSIIVDHGPWAGILEAYLDADHPSDINRFDYAGVLPRDRQVLEDYLSALGAVNPSELKRDEQMAYWINFYNALTVRVILDAYPVDSIRDISLPGSRRGPWQAKLTQVNGVALSLDDIEHGILRPIWKDARIHYAVNCASLGCPNLAPVPYSADRLDAMLDRAARDYVNHPRGVSAEGRRLGLSSIYQWYAEDFGGRSGLKEHLLTYADGRTAEIIRQAGNQFRYDYDWSLNEPE